MMELWDVGWTLWGKWASKVGIMSELEEGWSSLNFWKKVEPSVEHFEHFRKSGGHWVNLEKMEIGLAPLGEIGQ
jgi:hypothetical protein